MRTNIILILIIIAYNLPHINTLPLLQSNKPIIELKIKNPFIESIIIKYLTNNFNNNILLKNRNNTDIALLSFEMCKSNNYVIVNNNDVNLYILLFIIYVISIIIVLF
jgi:hypothetical protein